MIVSSLIYSKILGGYSPPAPPVPTPMQESHARLVAFGGERLNTCGRITMKCEHKGNSYAVNFEVSSPKHLGLT